MAPSRPASARPELPRPFFDARGKLIQVHPGGYATRDDPLADVQRYLRA